MVSQKYRWDFIGLSTDTKPTSETSDKVVNGSTYYCSDTSKLYVYCDGTWYERKPLGGGGGGGTSDFNDLSNRPKYNGSDMTGSTNIPEVKTYTAGSNVAISDQNVISATDTTYSAFTGTDGTTAGVTGLVPAPATTDAGKFLKADGTWDTAGGGGGITELTTADYNWPTNSPDGVALWVLDAGVYLVAKDAKIYSTSSSYTNYATWAVVSNKTYNPSATKNMTVIFDSPYHSNTNPQCWGIVDETVANGSSIGTRYYINKSPIANLTSGSNQDYLSAYQGKVLKDLIDSIAIRASGAPTTSTVGQVGTLYEDTTNGKLYQCTAVSGNTYTWTEVGAGGGGSGPTVVQTTGTSTTDVMSQNAVTSMVYADPSTTQKVNIGGSIDSNAAYGTVIGYQASILTGANRSVAIGYRASAIQPGSVALGTGSGTSMVGEVNIGSATTTAYGYNNSNYRLLTGVYDPQSAHDAATKGYVDGLATMGTLSASPTGTTVGVPGRLYTYDSGGGTYEVYLCVHDNGDNTYVWKQVSLI